MAVPDMDMDMENDIPSQLQIERLKARREQVEYGTFKTVTTRYKAVTDMENTHKTVTDM